MLVRPAIFIICLLLISGCDNCQTDYSDCDVCDALDFGKYTINAYCRCRGGLLVNNEMAFIVKTPSDGGCEIPLVAISGNSVALSQIGKGLVGIKVNYNESSFWNYKYFIQNINCKPARIAAFGDTDLSALLADMKDYREYIFGGYWVSTSSAELTHELIRVQVDFAKNSGEHEDYYFTYAQSISFIKTEDNNPIFKVTWELSTSSVIKFHLDNYLYTDDIIEVLDE